MCDWSSDVCSSDLRCELSHPLPRPARTVSHLADASDRAGDEPGLTDLLRLSGSESEIGATIVGAYFFVHRFFNEVSNAVLGPLLRISTHEVETIHPLVVEPVPTRPSCHAA